MTSEIGVRHYPGESPLSKINIVREREVDLVEAIVPLDLISTEDVPVDQDHVKNICASIQKEEAGGKKNGQLTPLLLGEINGSSSLCILDGFHRTVAMKDMGKKEVFATVRLNCTKEEALDLRIISAVSHKSVNFARTVEWSQQAWDLSPWAGKVKLTKAFDLRFSDRKPRIDLGEDEIGKIKEWIDDKCRMWGIHGPTLHQYMTIAQNSDPQLVKTVRFSPGGSGGLKVLTVNHMREISRFLPGNYDSQKIAAEVILHNELRVTDARKLVEAMSSAETRADAIRIANGESWKEVGGRPSKDKPVEENNLSGEIARLREELFLAEERLALLFVNRLKTESERLKAHQAKEEDIPSIKKETLTLPYQLRATFILLRKYNLPVADLAKVLGQTGEVIVERLNRISDLVGPTAAVPNVRRVEVKVDHPIKKDLPKTPVLAVPIVNRENHQPDVDGSAATQQKAGVIFKGNSVSEKAVGVAQGASTPESSRKPEDFKVNGKISSLAGGDSGVILGTKELNGVQCVTMEVTRGRGRFISTIPINKFDISYKLEN